MSEYKKLFLDPRWQKLRLEILDRDKFTCQRCLSTDKTLHVHHQYYLNDGRLPWEYHSSLLITLCADCHKDEELMKGYDDYIVKTLLSYGLLREDLDQLTLAIGYALTDGVVKFDKTPLEIRSLFKKLLETIKNTVNG